MEMFAQNELVFDIHTVLQGKLAISKNIGISLWNFKNSTSPCPVWSTVDLRQSTPTMRVTQCVARLRLQQQQVKLVWNRCKRRHVMSRWWIMRVVNSGE